MEIVCKNKLELALENGPGYSMELKLQKNELEDVRNFISEHWLDTIQRKCPSNWQEFKSYGIYRYHLLSHLIDHSTTWSKSSRMLPADMVKKIRAMSLIKEIEKFYGPVQIVDEEDIGYEEIDWRLVRPNQPTDIGPIHADSWFSELGHGIIPPKGMKAIKVWVAIYNEPGLNGLKVVPNSQKKSWRYHGEFRHGFVKPQIDEDEDLLNPILLPTMPGDAVVFSDKLLHGGAINKGQYTRVSMEFMLFVKESN